MSFLAPWSKLRHDGVLPLVDDESLQAIYLAATANTAPTLAIQREVQQLLLGERQSTHVGSGYEFAENVPLQRGDEARFINWRVFARTGEYYRKAFYEERRPQVWLILDRSSTMCFGTRTRLKIALAAQLALFHLFVAQRQQLLSGAVLLDEQPSWVKPAQSQAAMQELIAQLRQGCVPPADQATQHGLRALLAQLDLRLRPGCIVIIYSDFHELQADDMNLLHALSEKHRVLTRHIIDRSEVDLPTSGQYHFGSSNDGLSVDCSDTALHKQYHEHMQKHHAQIAGWLQQAGCDYQRYLADAELFISPESHND